MEKKKLSSNQTKEVIMTLFDVIDDNLLIYVVHKMIESQKSVYL